MKKNSLFNLFSLTFLSLSVLCGLTMGSKAEAGTDDDLREIIQNNLPDGDEINSFLQISPRQAWISTAYSHSDSIQTASCALSFIEISDDATPYIGHSLTFLTSLSPGKIRAFNKSWTLPTESEGNMTLKNGSFNQSFNTIAQTPNLIETDLSTRNLQNILSGIGYEQEVWLSFSTGEPQSLPTARIIPLINDFKNCSKENHFANLGGPLDARITASDNPFEIKSSPKG